MATGENWVRTARKEEAIVIVDKSMLEDWAMMQMVTEDLTVVGLHIAEVAGHDDAGYKDAGVGFLT